MPVTECRYFNGYKPCGRSQSCDQECPSKDIPTTRLLLIHLGALGAVVRSTALLKPLRRKFPGAHLTWVTDAPAHQLLQDHPSIDRVLTTCESDLLSLSALEFDVAFVVDKSLKASGVLGRTKADLILGFQVDGRTGAILPATKAAEELWSLGLDNHKKFFVNKKSEIQLVTEALELGPWQNDDYHLPLLGQRTKVEERYREWSQNGNRWVIGINTGCSDAIPAKKLSVAFQRSLVQRLSQQSDVQVVLLGGPEDEIRNQQIAFGLPVISSPTGSGLRDGYASVAACDLVVTGDSLGMHLAIAAQKQVVAWFGPTCAHEIEFFGRGEAILTAAPCAPCWKRVCGEKQMCYDQVDLEQIMAAVKRGLLACRNNNLNFNLSSRQPSLGTSS